MRLRNDFTSNEEYNRVSVYLTETLEDKRILEAELLSAQVVRDNAVTMSSEAEARVISLKGRVEQTERELHDLRAVLEQRSRELVTTRTELTAAEEQRTQAMQENLALETQKSLILTQIGNARMALRKETDARETAVAALHRQQGEEDAVRHAHQAELQQSRHELERLVVKHKGELDDLRGGHQVQSERVKAQWAHEVETLTAKHAAETAQLSAHYQGEAEQASRVTEWRVAEVKEAAAVAHAKHQTDMQHLREKHHTEIEQLRSDLTSKMTNGSQQMRSVFDAAQHELESSLEMSSLANSELQDQLAESQREAEALLASCSSYQKTILDLRTQVSTLSRQCDALESECTTLREDKEVYAGSIATYQRVVSELRAQTVPFEEHVAVNRSLQEDKSLLIAHIHNIQGQIDEFKRAVLDGVGSVDGDASPRPFAAAGEQRSFSTSQVERIIHSHTLQQQQQHQRSLSPSSSSRYRRLQEEGAYRLNNLSASATPASSVERAFFDRTPPPSIHGSSSATLSRVSSSTRSASSPRANPSGLSRTLPVESFAASTSPHKHGTSSFHQSLQRARSRSRSPSPRRNAITALAAHSSPAAPMFSPGLAEYPSPVMSPSPAPPSRIHARKQPSSPQTIRGLSTALSAENLSYSS
eukprot:gene24833-31221_t